ncbi:MAG: transposase [Verrucomicrobiae bacterium]|nr:transposase [Verrucomicrobiae bacterium]
MLQINANENFTGGVVDAGSGFDHLGDLERRRIFWVTRAKENMVYRVVKKFPTRHEPKILKDEIIALQKPSAGAPELMRRIVALVEVDGKQREMTFLTNHLEWAPWTVAELYRCRWDIEVFFKQIKQTLRLTDFIGQNANAVRWQIWMALLVYLLIRLHAFLSKWGQSFNRLVTLLRSALWLKLDLISLLDNYGTATNFMEAFSDRKFINPALAFMESLPLKRGRKTQFFKIMG